jgi:hypothetical protein|tara:strand:- start:43 stop:273 length:231 start_codon:yes stop_codon:yes gene_type:complete
MAKITVNGEALEIHPQVGLTWGRHESEIRERLPAVEILKSELIALNGAWVRRKVQLEEIGELEALMDIDLADLENR